VNIMPEFNTLLIALSAIAVATGLAWPRLRNRQSRKDRLLQQLRQSKRYWGVTIRNGKCAAVRKLAGKKYPLDAAPSLPVEGCRSLHCTCSYTGLLERRRRKRRSGLDRRLVLRFGDQHADRRSPVERRRRFYNLWDDQAG
jgi:hypothetical protein